MNDSSPYARRAHFLRSVAVGLVVVVSGRPALGQQPQPITVSGRVVEVDGSKLIGVTVSIRGTNTTAVTDAGGRYTIAAPPDAVLVFTRIGYRSIAAAVAGRTSVDVVMERWIALLPDVVVTGYQTQLRAEITGAVSSVDVESTNRQTSASVLQRLDGQVTGVTTEHGGSPGSRTTVRIRGISSFQNNDPLYVVDGTTLQDTYLNWLNPDDIASVDVLKDASAASIYGSRASNGVIVIETKHGRPGQRVVTLDIKTGVATPVRGYDSFLIRDALDYFQVVRTAYRNAGQNVPTNIYGNDTLGNNPKIPDFIWPNDCKPNPCSSNPSDSNHVDRATYSYPGNLITPGSPGTNWWKAVFGAGQVRNATLSVSGGREDNTYLVSFNYLDQQGTAAFSRFQRGGIRVNTDFGLDRFTIGENLSVTRERSYGGMDDSDLRLWHDLRGPNFAPDIMQQPVVPIYDIAGHYAAGHNVDGLTGLNNPLKVAWVNSQNVFTNSRVFGNVFASFDASHGIALRTQLGLSLGQRTSHGFRPTFPENPGDFGSAIWETYNLSTDWTWSNTVSWVRTGVRHNVSVLLGQEASKNTNRFESGSCANLLSADQSARYIQDALCDPKTKSVFSSGGISTLLSFFGKADYNYGDRYYFNVTLRRDGSSRFGPTHRWGTFPAFGAGWRLSRESFLAHSSLVSNMMLRFGFGITGNQEIPPGRIVSLYGGDRGDTFYDIGGTTTSLRPGFKVVKAGNPNLKWEENRSVNVGLDLEFLGGRGSLSADVYERKSSNLFFDPRTPATAGSADPPILNIGEVQNNGIEFSIGYRGTIAGNTLWSGTFHGSHYRNKIVRIDANGKSAFFVTGLFDVGPEVVINQIGQPIGAFYGLVADGYYRDSAEAAPYWNDGARPGRIKFKDLNGDGTITPADRAVIGSPRPDFTADLDLALHFSHWDVSATLFGTFGNKIFNAQKRYYVFEDNGSNVRKDLLTNSAVLDGPCNASGCSGKLTNPGAKYPRVDVSDVFSRQYSSYYVENGSYIRLRVLQIAYNLPPALVRWIPAARVYVQAENLFTITGYSGPDPALPAFDVTGRFGDIRDQYRGVDGGSYPSNRTITIGISTTL